MWVNEPPADCQKVWHEWAGNFFKGKTILDIGAGNGLSKERMQKNGNKVTTHDINRAMMDNVDIICNLEDIPEGYDIVTAFDVIEHVAKVDSFLYDCFGLWEEGLFFTTPNKFVINRNWHYEPHEFCSLLLESLGIGRRYTFFGRFNDPGNDRIMELEEKEFMNNKEMYGMGIYVEKI